MRKLIILLLILFELNSVTKSVNPIRFSESEFCNPSMTYRPYVWWHWAGYNISFEGITKDLEAMKTAGIGGATILQINPGFEKEHILPE